MSRPSEQHELAVEAVRELYDSTDGALFALAFGEQIHLGGFNASMQLAELAGIRGGSGADLCCCYGAGMRFLRRYRDVETMIGVDISPEVLRQGAERCAADGIANVEYRCEDACATSIPSDSLDFVWSEDAWCYVGDKDRLIREAVRVVRPGGVIAFTDWVEGAGLSDDERGFLLGGMNFPNLNTQQDYTQLLEQAGCNILVAEDTSLFSRQLDLVVEMLDTQYRWDALRLTSFDQDRVDLVVQGLRLIAEWGRAGKVSQSRIVARVGQA